MEDAQGSLSAKIIPAAVMKLLSVSQLARGTPQSHTIRDKEEGVKTSPETLEPQLGASYHS